MNQKILFLYLLLLGQINAQTYPAYGPPLNVSIIGLTFDAMEPFISADGNYLFFNNLNDGITTKLYYATYVNDSTFNFEGELSGTNQTVTPYLDAVADMDALGNFYWTSTRQYPAEMENLFHGNFSSGIVTDSARLQGDFYILVPGWLIMDHGISADGNYLYYNNARFDGGAAPVETIIGIAEKINDSTFNKISASATIMAAINNPAYIFYAPCITADQLELYYTRFPSGPVTASTTFEVCVAIRNDIGDPFSAPQVLFSENIVNLVEAPTLTTDKSKLYYHRKEDGTHRIKLRKRLFFSGITIETESDENVNIVLKENSIVVHSYSTFESVRIFNLNGELVSSHTNINSTEFSSLIPNLVKGIYIIEIMQSNKEVLYKKIPLNT